MKKIIKKLRKLNNSGSSIVIVIAALAFLAIVIGSLLTAAGYAYKMKFQDLNARDNYYYVEQAMNEVYAGIGADTMDAIKEAYIYTVEHMTYYDETKKMYVTRPDDECQLMFEEQFMTIFANNPDYMNASDTYDRISKFVTNNTVKVANDSIKIERNGKVVGDKTIITEVIIHDIKLTRTQEYKKSVANGSFTQTISTDIVVGKPDFKVLFNSANTDYSNLFDYAVIADMGVEVNQPLNPLTINGDVYAANDFYNKLYNEKLYDASASDRPLTLSGVDQKYNVYKHVPVTSKTISSSTNDYRNKTELFNNTPVDKTVFDGENIRSMYSGIYVDHSDVSVIAKKVIVPGTIAVMDRGSLSIYGRNGKLASETEVWTDNLVLGGFSAKTYARDDVEKLHPIYKGSTAIIKGSLYVRDDTELNAAGAKIQLNGSYYGYGDSTTRDSRKFISTVEEDNFVITEVDSAGNEMKTNRGHYNSSAIIVNGEQSDIDFTYLNNLFIAGRTYVEMSKTVKEEDNVELSFVDQDGNKIDFTDADGNTVNKETGVRQTYTYNPKETIKDADGNDETVFIRDYKLGESMSIRSNYKAYVPIMYSGMPEKAANDDPTFGEYYEAELHIALQGSDLFEKYFPSSVYNNKIPCVMQVVSGKKYFYYHFNKVFNDLQTLKAANNTLPGETDALIAAGSTAEGFAAQFIQDYTAELNNPDSVIRDYLVNIADYEDFESGNIILPGPASTTSHIYSSGAITTKTGTTFDITLSRNANGNVLNDLFSGSKYVASGSRSIASIGRDLNKEYEYMKWNLGHYTETEAAAGEKAYVDNLVASDSFGDAAITPINRYLNFDKITDTVSYTPNSTSGSASSNADFSDEMQIWIKYQDVLVSDLDGNNDGNVTGIIVTKGDVEFDSSVKHFSGIIVAGGKVYVNNQVTTIQSSPQTCITLLRNCQMSNNDEAKFILELFKVSSESSEAAPTDTDGARTIDTIDYSDVVSFSNFMKNVE